MLWMQQLQSVDWRQAFVCMMTAYALGCFATGYYLVRSWTGTDIRDVDSGSAPIAMIPMKTCRRNNSWRVSRTNRPDPRTVSAPSG